MASAWDDGWLEGVRHVCFDKDGTLIDVHGYWHYTSQLRAERIRERFRLPEPCGAEVLDAMGIDARAGRIRPHGPVGYAPRAVIVEHVIRYLGGRGVVTTSEELHDLFQAIDAQQQQTKDYRVELLPGIPSFLRRLHAQGLALSIYSSDRREHIRTIVEQLALTPLFADVVGGGCVTRPKPDPEGFLMACERVKIPPAQSIYIGDTVRDLAMGKAGGAHKVIGVGSGLDGLEALARETPYVCARLAEPLGSHEVR